MMVYGIDKDKYNDDKMLKIFCMYGNVMSVKFMKKKEGCDMVKMGDGMEVERCVKKMNNVYIMG